MKKIDNLTKIIEEKDEQINKLVEKMNALEEKVIGKERNNIEYETKNISVQCEITETQVSEIGVQTEECFKCDVCDFETSKEKGLKIHKKRKHGAKAVCDLCEETFETTRDLKIHRNKHSYISNEYETENKCKKCDFQSETIETMEVHVGKHKVEYFECGLCDYKFEDLGKLTTHLLSCEVYECGECYWRDKDLSKVKTHVRDGHERTTNLHHLKIDREDETKVKFKNYYLSQL